VTVGDGTTAGGRARARWTRSRVAVGVVVLAVLAGVAGVLAQPRTAGGALDPDSATPQGARALAQVLGRQGVEVVRVERVADAVDLAGSAGTTLLVVDAEVLPPDRLRELASSPADLVLVAPDGPVLAELAPSLQPAGVVDAVAGDPGCPDAHAEAAGRALAGGRLVRPTGDAAAATVCYPDAVEPVAGSYAVTREGGREVRVVGQGGVLANEHLGSDGNAALALRTLGRHPRLVWLMAHPLDTTADEQVGPLDLLPRWVPWVLLQLGLVAVLAMLWRGRRLGALVDEPLPVVVRSAETAEGRAGLYRAAGARARAAAVLRAAAMRRLAPRLGLPATASGEEVAAAVTRTAGREHAAVVALLLGPPPQDDAALTALADDLDALERETVHRDTSTREARTP
jgi:hypothetical protein